MKKRFLAIALTLILCCSAMFVLSACGENDLQCSKGMTPDDPWTYSVNAKFDNPTASGTFTFKDGTYKYKKNGKDAEETVNGMSLADLLKSEAAACVHGDVDTRTATEAGETRHFQLTAYGCTITIYYTVS